MFESALVEFIDYVTQRKSIPAFLIYSVTPFETLIGAKQICCRLSGRNAQGYNSPILYGNET